MKIVWDQPKRIANLELRGLDFAMVTLPFFETAQILPAKKDRFLAVGLISGRPYAVIFKPLGTEALSIISLRLASPKERTLL
jgi:uncharacterized DUF497 family protein